MWDRLVIVLEILISNSLLYFDSYLLLSWSQLRSIHVKNQKQMELDPASLEPNGSNAVYFIKS